MCVNKRHLPPVGLRRIQTKETRIVHKRNIYIHKRNLLIRTQKRRIHTQKISASSGTRDDTHKRDLLILHARDPSIYLQKRRRFTPKKLTNMYTKETYETYIYIFRSLLCIYRSHRETYVYTKETKETYMYTKEIGFQLIHRNCIQETHHYTKET